MAESTARMLRLLSLLQTHRFWSGGELADRLEVTPRTVRRDVDRLRELGYPVHATRGAAGGYQLGAGRDLPPLLLDDDEAVAVAVSLRTAAGGAVTGIEETSVSALGKLVQVMPPRLRHRVQALQAYTVPAGLAGPTVDAEVLTTIAQACRDDERLALTYRPRDGDSAERTVEPHRLVSLGRRWYLVAWDLDRADWRTFRVDRMSAPRTTGVRFRQRELPAEDAAAFVRRGVEASAPLLQVEVDVYGPAEQVRTVTGRWAEVTAAGDGACRMSMTVDTLDWALLLLGSLPYDFRVVSPPELAGRLAAAGERFVRCTADGDAVSRRATAQSVPADGV